MPLDILTFGEALVEMNRAGVEPLDRPGTFIGPYPGGAPLILAVQAARLGAPVGVLGCVGDDAFGRCILAHLRVDGVETRGVKTLSTYATGVTFAAAYTVVGTRDSIAHVRHSAAGQLSAAPLDSALFDGLKCLHVIGSTLSIHDEMFAFGLQALELAQKGGAKISFDPNLRPRLMPIEQARQVFQAFLKAADIIMLTADEALLLTQAPTYNDAIRVLLDNHAERAVIVKRGAEGCTTYQTHHTRDDMMYVHFVEGYDVEAVDSSGAGDCFDAGFLVRWLAGDDVMTAAMFANACGALAVTAQGSTAGAKTFDEVLMFMKARS